MCVTCCPVFSQQPCKALMGILYQKCYFTGRCLPKWNSVVSKKKPNTSWWQYLTQQCSFFHPPAASLADIVAPAQTKPPRPTIQGLRAHCASGPLWHSRKHTLRRSKVKKLEVKTDSLLFGFSFGNMENCKGCLMVLFLQLCISEGRVISKFCRYN